MEYVNWYLKVLQQYYAKFDGRAGMKEYWSFVLVNIFPSIILGLIGLHTIQLLYGLAMIVPSIAVGVRRLHDIGKSGWMMLVVFIPIAGIIWLIILMVKEGDPEENEYGVKPDNQLPETKNQN